MSTKINYAKMRTIFSLIMGGAILVVSWMTTKPDRVFPQTVSGKLVVFDTISSFRSSTSRLKSNYIPDSVFQMTNLKNLSIQGMDCDYGDRTNCWMIAEIPPQIKNLKKLESLQLNVNAIRTIPPELTELKHLKSLDLTDNLGLSNIENIVEMSNLEELSLYGCNISKLPANIGKLKKLKSLGLTGNHINGPERARIKKELPDCNIQFD